jgi:O-acetyl-ADP-ribose deacetylase (regulator of RNase III)
MIAYSVDARQLLQKLTRGQLYYITNTNSLPSILQHGLLSHDFVQSMHIKHATVYNEDVISRRKNISTPSKISLWNYANMYLQPRNPILYQLMKDTATSDVCVLTVDSTALNVPGICYTDGNAAHKQTTIKLLENITAEDAKKIRENVDKDWWSDVDNSKRTIMAEVLVPQMVEPQNITGCYVPNNQSLKDIDTVSPHTIKQLRITTNPKLFFSNNLVTKVTPKLSLVQGDMFFSTMDTLTIAVNCVGVMGKGLACTCKYRFPDAYVVYQDYCKEKRVRPGVPSLYTRGASFYNELALDLNDLHEINGHKWFLFFPTKRDWRENSNIKDIERGMIWLAENYKSLGISKIALPALGCGLGNLKWQDVGPIMCKYLSQMNVIAEIYLSTEPDSEIGHEFVTADYLLR